MLKLTQLQSSYDTGILMTQHALFQIQWCMWNNACWVIRIPVS